MGLCFDGIDNLIFGRLKTNIGVGIDFLLSILTPNNGIKIEAVEVAQFIAQENVK